MPTTEGMLQRLNNAADFVVDHYNALIDVDQDVIDCVNAVVNLTSYLCTYDDEWLLWLSDLNQHDAIFVRQIRENYGTGEDAAFLYTLLGLIPEEVS